MPGPAPAGVTDHIYDLTKKISEYHTVPDLKVDISTKGTQQFTVDDKQFTVEVIDSVQDYMDYMKTIFDFDAIRSLLSGSGGQPKLKVLINALSGGAYMLTAMDMSEHSRVTAQTDSSFKSCLSIDAPYQDV